MPIKFFIIFVFFVFSIKTTSSQELIRIMGYNLLYFGTNTSFCTPENNNYKIKTEYLKTIVDHVKPDILVVTELSPDVYYTNYILKNVFNSDEGLTNYIAAELTSESGGNLANGLFYDSTKFSLFSQNVIKTSLRDLNAYKLRYKKSSETLFLNIIVGHLKAGKSASDRLIRAEMVEQAMNYVENIGNNNNFLIMGDLNVYNSDEIAFQKIINPQNPDLAFFDPIDEIGYWHSNSTFSHVHTQSTRTDNSNPCFVTGGMDDRFDFILVDEGILNGTYNIKYKKNSYVTMGQDGLRFNSSLIEPENNSLPSNIIEALYNMSDHLPIYADFYFGNINHIESKMEVKKFSAKLSNPVNKNFIFEINSIYNQTVEVYIYDLLGQKIKNKSINVNNNYSGKICAKSISDGLYIISFKGNDFVESYRIIKVSN